MKETLTDTADTEMEYYNVLPLFVDPVNGGGGSQRTSECSETESARPRTNSASPEVHHHHQQHTSEPQRPPRARDEEDQTVITLKKKENSYCNIPPPPPSLPRRQPHLKRQCTSPSTTKKRIPPPPPPSQPPPSQTTSLLYQNQPELLMNRPQSAPIFRRMTANSSSLRRKRQQQQHCQCEYRQQRNEIEDWKEEGNEILLIYSRFCSGAVEWAKYLNKLFTELSKHKGKMSIRHLPVEDLSGGSGNSFPQRIETEIFYESRLQLVLISPTLLQFLFKNPTFVLGKLLYPDRVLAVMLGVHDRQVQPEHRSSFVSYSQWIHLEAKDHDLEFVQTVLYFSTQILNRNRQPAAVNGGCSMEGSRSLRTRNRHRSHGSHSHTESTATTTVNGSRPENGVFHIHPKKVNENHSRVVIVFESPQSSCSKFSLRLERRHAGLQDVQLTEWRLINPYNIQTTVPGCCFAVTNLASIRVIVDGCDRGTRLVKLESAVSELDQLLRTALDPMDFMCQTMGIASTAELDKRLTRMFNEKTPYNGFQPRENSYANVNRKNQGDFPTLLHFSAFHGLIELTAAILNCPGAEIALEIRNSSEMTPGELAQLNGHKSLAEKLFNLQSSRQQQQDDESEVKASSQYQVPPPPRPVFEAAGLLSRNDSFGSIKFVSTPIPKEKISTSVQTMPIAKRKAKESSSPQYQEIKSPLRNVDRFGTLRASKRILRGKKDSVELEDLDDVFLPTNNNNNNNDKVNKNDDAREGEENDELTLTNELLRLIESYRKGGLSLKDFEAKLEEWRKKAAVSDSAAELKHVKSKEFEDIKDKVKKCKNISTLLRNFKLTPNNNNNNNSNNSKGDKIVATTWPIPPDSNDTIVEGELNVINENDMSVVVLPPTPPKENNNPETMMMTKQTLDRQVSSQILPLSRLSLSSSSSSSGNSPPNPNPNPEAAKSPVKEKFSKLKKWKEFMQHQQQTPTCEDEPENLLNTPKSLLMQEKNKNNNSNIIKKGRILFGGGEKQKKDNNDSSSKQYENLPPIIITDM